MIDSLGELNRSNIKEGLRAVRSMDSKGDLWQDTHTLPSISYLQPGSSGVENLGSGDYSSQDGSLPSCSTTSSERNHSTGTTTGSDDIGAMLKDDEVRAMLIDEDVRAMLKKVTVNEGVLNKAIQSLGGGEQGLKGLMGYIMLWVKQQRESKSSSPQQPLPSSNSLLTSSSSGDVTLQPNSDAFQCLSGVLQPPSTKQVPERDMHHFQRFKSRRLMMGEPEMGAGLENVDTGFCPSSFLSTPEVYKPEMASPGILAPGIPQLSYGMPLQPPVMPFTNAHIGMPSAEQTPAMATRAARRHRMARQRQSIQSRAASHAATTPASVGSGSSLNNCAVPSTLKKSGSSGAQTTFQSSPAIVGRKGQTKESLALLLQKELRPSDVGNLGRIILPKKEAEQHMPSPAMRGGMSIKIEDFDSGHIWNLRYSVTSPPKMGSSPLVTSGASSFWPNNKSRMYLLENTGDFVKSHRLVEGDLLLLYRGHQGGYVMRGKKKRVHRSEVEPVQMKFAHSLADGSHVEPTSPKENGMLVQRLYGGGPPEKCVKEEPAALDDDPFLKEMMLSMGPSLESDSSLHTLERFPSLNLDFHLEEIMAETKSKSEG